jgi:hypothetical protein
MIRIDIDDKSILKGFISRYGVGDGNGLVV